MYESWTTSGRFRILTFLFFAALPVILWYQTFRVSLPRQSGNPGFILTADANRGYVTAENDAVKVVWHYATLPTEYSNRGGGNIYELYDKTTDPSMQRNLVASVNAGGGWTSPPMAGIGGLGATCIYEKGFPYALADNGVFAILESRVHYLDEAGNAIFEATYVIRSGANASLKDYRVTKKWTVHTAGQIYYEVMMTFLRDFEIGQPAYNFSFNRAYGWRTAAAVRHMWGPAICSGAGTCGVDNINNGTLVFNQIDAVPDTDYPLYHVQGFSLYGQDGGDSVSVKMDNNGKGWENGGLFGLGQSLWLNTTNTTGEFSDYAQNANGHTLRFFAWWSGGPPREDRFKPVTGGTTVSDSLWIEMHPHTSTPAPAFAESPSAKQVISDSAVIHWSTDTANDTRVAYWPQGSAETSYATAGGWFLDHEIPLTGLVPQTTYEYKATSHDSLGKVEYGGWFTTPGIQGTVRLRIDQDAVRWDTYADYVNRQLSVDFLLTNLGTEEATNVVITRIKAGNEVKVAAFDPAVPNIPAGGSQRVTVRYSLPAAVQSFRTTLYVQASNSSGVTFRFP